ncbi:ABC transporter permease [Spirochaetia bacterium]|nr:ABC transporter permease [Spirochaetia bacterium]
MRDKIKYILITLIRMLLLLFGVTVLGFILVVSSPFDPLDAFGGGEVGMSPERRAFISAHWGLDKTKTERYFIWLGNILKGDMGDSITFRRPVSEVIANGIAASLALMFSAWVLSGILGFALGVAAGSLEYSLFDKCVRGFCFVLASTPVFWLGLLLLMFFSVYLGWFPLGFGTPIGMAAADVKFGDRIYHLILPALTLSITSVANITLHTRQKLIDILKTEYMLFAQARGETKRQAVIRHGLRNIAPPALTLQFASFSELFGGSVLAESVFSYPGLGNAAVKAGLAGDAPTLLGVALFAAIFVFAGNLCANILYGVLNPQIRNV